MFYGGILLTHIVAQKTAREIIDASGIKEQLENQGD